MSEQTYTITVTGTQLGLLCEAAELLSRIHIGQLNHVEEHLHGLPIDERLKLREGLNALNPLVTGLEYLHASRALNDRMRLRHEQAWGVYWGLRYPIYLERCAELGEEPGSWTVMSHVPQPCGGQPVPAVTRVDAELPGIKTTDDAFIDKKGVS
jgi:hypothetical protein